MCGVSAQPQLTRAHLTKARELLQCKGLPSRAVVYVRGGERSCHGMTRVKGLVSCVTGRQRSAYESWVLVTMPEQIIVNCAVFDALWMKHVVKARKRDLTDSVGGNHTTNARCVRGGYEPRGPPQKMSMTPVRNLDGVRLRLLLFFSPGSVCSGHDYCTLAKHLVSTL